MALQFSVGAVHHVRLSVTDVDRSRQFYTEVLGFEVAMDAPPPADDPNHEMLVHTLQGGVVLSTGDLLVGLRPVDAGRRAGGDGFDPFRVGLDHLSFNVASRAELEAAAAMLDSQGATRGEIADLPPFGISVLSLEDPDGIQLELTAPLEG